MMKTQDTARWLAQKAELAQSEDPEIGRSVLEFIEEWCSRAEQVLDHCDHYSDVSLFTAAEALRRTLVATEQAQNVWIPSHMLGQVLVAICANWEYGIDLYDEMTELEKRLVETSAAMIVDQQQASAELAEGKMDHGKNI